MTNPITYAVERIKRSGIPKEVLNFAFMDIIGNVETIDSVLEGIIRRTALQDISDAVGDKVYIPLKEDYVVKRDVGIGTVIRIPSEALQHKSILEVLQVTRNTMFYSNTQFFGRYDTGSNMESEAMKMMDNLSSASVESSAGVIMLGKNTFFIRDYYYTIDILSALVKVSYHENLPELSSAAKPKWFKFCKLAVEMEIYNKVIVMLDEGAISQGHNIGMLKTKIESYESAEEQYYEMLENEMYKIMMFSDKNGIRKIAKMGVPNTY